MVATPSLFKSRFNIDVKTKTEVLSFTPAAQEVVTRSLDNMEERVEKYDVLVLATGARGEGVAPCLHAPHAAAHGPD